MRAPGVKPGCVHLTTKQSKSQLFPNFLTIHTASLSICNKMSPKPQDKSQPHEANSSGTSRKQTGMQLTETRHKWFNHI